MACGSQGPDQSESYQSEFAGLCTTASGDFLDCGDRHCAWDCAGENGCIAACGDEAEETIDIQVTGPTSYWIANGIADCHLGEMVEPGYSQVLTVDYRGDDDSSLSLRVFDFLGAGDYNVGGGKSGRVLGTFNAPDGTTWSSVYCWVSLAATEDGGLKTTACNFHCMLTDRPFFEGGEEAQLDVQFSCNPRALWAYRY